MEEHKGKAPNKRSKDPEESRLGRFESNCRFLKKKNRLSPEREEALVAIGWVFDPLEAAFQQNLLADKKFREEHNGKAPSSDSKDPEERRLAKFERKCRDAKKKGKLQEREEALIAIGWVFDPFGEAFQQNLLADKKFREEHNGKAPSSGSKDLEEKRLGDFELSCRDAKKKGKLSQEREEALIAIGWVFDPFEEKWQAKFMEVKDLIQDTGKITESRSNTAYQWYRRNVKKLYDGKMDAQHYKQLKRAKVPVDDQEKDEKSIADFFENLDETINKPK